jgi:putative membrane protein
MSLKGSSTGSSSEEESDIESIEIPTKNGNSNGNVNEDRKSSIIVGTPAFHAERQYDRRDIDGTLIYDPTHKWWDPPARAWILSLNQEIVGALIVWNIVVVLLARYTNLCGSYESNRHQGGLFCDEDWVMSDDTVYNTLGVGMFLLLSFRAQEGYSRFWEGRKAWGRVKECCRDLTRQICFHVKVSSEADKKERTRAIGFVGAFAASLKLTLRRERNPMPELGDILIFQDILNIERQQVMPQFCLDVLTYYLVEQQKAGKVGEYTLGVMTTTCLAVLADAHGTCERIRNQPIPLSYTLHLRFVLVLWLVLYPFHLVSAYGWYSILLASLVDYAVLGIEAMACEIENPFGYHKNCIDLCTYCKGIIADTQEILARVEHVDAVRVFDGGKVRKENDCLFAEASPEERKELDKMVAMRDVCRKTKGGLQIKKSK